MKSRWFELKSKAISLREKGKSIRDVEKTLDIPRSTLSGWFRDIKLTSLQKKRLKRKHERALIKARKGATKWHNGQKEDRLRTAEIEADKTLNKIDKDREILELSLAMLYLGEGYKAGSATSLGNSDPLILKFFLKVMKFVYNLKMENISFYLHLRADQDPELLKKYWAKKLEMPTDRFRKVSIDKRTLGTKTYPNYKGVCIISCGNVAIQRKLVYIGRKFCQEIADNLGG
ncbi:MAG: hypothetical protein WC640_02220 [Candidatus Paceibacterota bacterium]|jgi:hypothetical protein